MIFVEYRCVNLCDTYKLEFYSYFFSLFWTPYLVEERVIIGQALNLCISAFPGFNGLYWGIRCFQVQMQTLTLNSIIGLPVQDAIIWVPEKVSKCMSSRHYVPWEQGPYVSFSSCE